MGIRSYFSFTTLNIGRCPSLLEEALKQFGGFGSKQPLFHDGPVIQQRRIRQREFTAHGSKANIARSENESLNSCVHNCTGTHYARLKGHIKD